MVLLHHLLRLESSLSFFKLRMGFEGKQAALFEGTTMLIAAFLLSTMIIWMGRNKNVASLKKNLRYN